MKLINRGFSTLWTTNFGTFQLQAHALFERAKQCLRRTGSKQSDEHQLEGALEQLALPGSWGWKAWLFAWNPPGAAGAAAGRAAAAGLALSLPAGVLDD